MDINQILKRGKRKLHCTQDENTKEVVCKTVREDSEGNIVPLAEATFSFDNNCNPVASNLVEHEEGELEKLNKKASSLLSNKCKSRPSDY